MNLTGFTRRLLVSDYASYTHITEVAHHAGERPDEDGLILVGSLPVLENPRAGRRLAVTEVLAIAGGAR